jgi:type I restriction enzyme M protein
MTRPTVEDDKHAFAEQLAKLGGYSGNVRLRGELQWTEERYWRTHSILLDEGSIVRGRGKGGSVTLIQIENATPNEEIAVAPVATPGPKNREFAN